jgi:hypothetical protein
VDTATVALGFTSDRRLAIIDMIAPEILKNGDNTYYGYTGKNLQMKTLSELIVRLYSGHG